MTRRNETRTGARHAVNRESRPGTTRLFPQVGVAVVTGTERQLGKMEHDDENVVVHRTDDQGRVSSVPWDGDGPPDGRDLADRVAPVRVPVSRGGIDGRIFHALREVARDSYTASLSNVEGRDLARASRIAASVVYEDIIVLRDFITLCKPWLKDHQHAKGDECQRCLFLPEVEAILAGYAHLTVRESRDSNSGGEA